MTKIDLRSTKVLWALALISPFTIATLTGVLPWLPKILDPLLNYGNQVHAIAFHLMHFIPSYIFLTLLQKPWKARLKAMALFTLALILLIPVLWGFFLFSSCYIFHQDCL